MLITFVDFLANYYFIATLSSLRIFQVICGHFITILKQISNYVKINLAISEWAYLPRHFQTYFTENPIPNCKLKTATVISSDLQNLISSNLPNLFFLLFVRCTNSNIKLFYKWVRWEWGRMTTLSMRVNQILLFILWPIGLHSAFFFSSSFLVTNSKTYSVFAYMPYFEL